MRSGQEIHSERRNQTCPFKPTNENARRDELITAHLHLVSAIAAHVQNSIPVHIELDDLIHAGTMGLFEAATKYRMTKK